MRVLLIGGGCRGLALAEGLVADGHAVRAVTRDPRSRARIERSGAECWVGDPDVVGTLRYALDNVTVLVWALGTARGAQRRVAALHGPRLEMMLARTIDSTVRGVVYEGAGSVAPQTLRAGAALLGRVCSRNAIPHAVLAADPRSAQGWARAARTAIDRLLADRGGSF